MAAAANRQDCTSEAGVGGERAQRAAAAGVGGSVGSGGSGVGQAGATKQDTPGSVLRRSSDGSPEPAEPASPQAHGRRTLGRPEATACPCGARSLS